MADFKYDTTSGSVQVWDADCKTYAEAQEKGKAHARFSPDALPGNIRSLILVNGCKTILQQRTSSLRGKEPLPVILQAMSDVFDNWTAGNWEAARTAGEAKKPLLVARLVWCLVESGNKTPEPTLFATLLLKKVDELEALTKHAKIAPIWERACAEVTSVPETGADVLGL